MTWVLLGLALMGAGALLALVWAPRMAKLPLGAGSVAVLGSLAVAIGAVETLWRATSVSLSLPWALPIGAGTVCLDPLAAWFLLPMALLGGLGALYGGRYLEPYAAQRSLRAAWFFYHVLLLSMALVFLAANAVPFLLAWELMSLSSFFLVCFESEKESVQRAGWTYLVATHLGGVPLVLFFVVAGYFAGSLEFSAYASMAPIPAAYASLLFVFALLGFGTKAGFLPLHVWLPEAHPAAPSHVSALMSGVMIKTGIYGLVRALSYLDTPPAWWGWLLVAVGASSGIVGVLFALAQHDLKRLLAYHSVENIGIIALGLGLGVLGQATGQSTMQTLGYAGALLHVLNHALFKGLLFLGAGAVLHRCHTANVEELGGLIKRMPWTAATFLVGAAAISGLPPLNGFVSELCIYVAAFGGAAHGSTELAIVSVLVVLALALIGGLAAACFAKAFGIVFLGESRSEHTHHASEVGWAMRGPMVALAALCGAVGLLAPEVLRGLVPALATLGTIDHAALADMGRVLRHVSLGASLLIALVLALIGLRRWLLSGREIGESGTWDCGYAQPTARMQYTASSFVQPFTSMFRALLRPKRERIAVSGLFPKPGAYASHVPDLFTDRLFRPLFVFVGRWPARIRWLQQGRVQLYVLYIAVTLLVLLMWKL